MKPRHFLGKGLNLLLAAMLSGLGGGCQAIQDHSLTCDLWSDSRGSSHCRPQAVPALQLFESDNPPDVLVAYNAVSDRRPGTQRRAYFLGANRARAAAGKPPQFVDARRAAGLTPIAVFNSPPQTNALASSNVVFAVCHGSTFTLYRPESTPEFCALPYYQDGCVGVSWGRAALTPLAVTADVVVGVTIAGLVAGVVAAYGLCQGAWVAR